MAKTSVTPYLRIWLVSLTFCQYLFSVWSDIINKEGGWGGGRGARGEREEGWGKKGKASQNISNYAQFLIPLHPKPSLFILQVIL